MKKVMLAEDEDWILQGLCNIIDWEELGLCVVHTAHDGAEARELFEKEAVDIVVTDVNMPKMDGLSMLADIRKKDKRVRAIILTGYDEFEYARTAIRLDVENYILKPIDEEKLQEALIQAMNKLEELDREKFAYADEKNELMQFLSGKVTKENWEGLKGVFTLAKKGSLGAAVMKLDLDSMEEPSLTDVIRLIQEETEEGIEVFPIENDLLLCIFVCAGEDVDVNREQILFLQERLEQIYGILTFVSISAPFYKVEEIPAHYKNAVKLQKYRMIDGYGNLVDNERIRERSTHDISVDNTLLSRLILKKDKKGAINYLEDLFINNIKADITADVLYQTAVKIAMLLVDIKKEYKLTGNEGLLDLSDIIDGIYHARDLATLKTVFVGEIIGIIDYLHTSDSQYTPVVKQLLIEVEKNYRADMNLKTLAYKYHMNTSYLGQIFQKEVGCSFSQYLSNRKNSRAKELILTTNMKINDIAKEVGYPDTSYFYRKFKQTYGVSPASLREMQKI